MSWLLSKLNIRPSLYPLSRVLMHDPIDIGVDELFRCLPFSIPNAARKTHAYVIGKSGMGKSKLLESLIVGDIVAGRGVALIDPHEDLVHDVMLHLLSLGFFDSEDNRKRVIYFEPRRADFAIPFNVLAVPRPSHVLADNIIEAFQRAFPTIAEAPRFRDVAKPALRVLIEAGATLVDLRSFLEDRAHRYLLLDQVRLRDAQLADDFEAYFHAGNTKERIENSDSTLNKLTDTIFDPDVRRALGHPKNVLDFKKIMDTSKVLLVNLHGLGDFAKRFFGGLLTVGFEQAAFDRVDNRTPFYLYLDEFPDFVANEGSSKTLANILSQCRKFGLSLTLAHQQIDQLKSSVITALGNINVKIAFASEYEDAKPLVHKFWIPDDEPMRIDPLAGLIQRLKQRTMLVKLDGWRVARILTKNIKPYRASHDALAELKTDLLQRHGVISHSTVGAFSKPPQAKRFSGAPAIVQP